MANGVQAAGSSVVTLPRYVAFKGDNDKYLAAYLTESHEYLQFNTTDILNECVRHEVVVVGEGTVMLKCLHLNKFWRRSGNCILADTVDINSSNNDLLFKPIKVNDQKVALRCLGNNLFCQRLQVNDHVSFGRRVINWLRKANTAAGKRDCLNAGTNALEETAHLGVEEPTVSRRMHSIEYHLDTVHIYNSQPEDLFQSAAGNPSDQPTSLEVAYAYTNKSSTTWKCGLSFATGVSTTIHAGIPHVVEGNLQISTQPTVSGEWGVTNEKQTTVTGTYIAPVKAGQTVEVTVKGIHTTCDVKFSYIQEDVLSTGETLQIRKDDGFFRGLSTMTIRFEVHYSESVIS